MQAKRKPRISSADSSKEYARRIRELRAALNLHPQEFAKELGVTRAAADRWERDKAKPGAANYIAMAKLAKTIDRLMEAGSRVEPRWFWEQAGVDEAAVKDLSSEFEAIYRNFERRMTEPAREGETVPVPLLRSIAHIDAPLLAPSHEIEAWLHLPKAIVPNPRSVSCMRVPHHLHEVSLGQNDVVLIDASQKKHFTIPGPVASSTSVPHLMAFYVAHRRRATLRVVRIGWLEESVSFDREGRPHDFAAILPPMISHGDDVPSLEELPPFNPAVGDLVLGRVLSWMSTGEIRQETLDVRKWIRLADAARDLRESEDVLLERVERGELQFAEWRNRIFVDREGVKKLSRPKGSR